MSMSRRARGHVTRFRRRCVESFGMLCRRARGCVILVSRLFVVCGMRTALDAVAEWVDRFTAVDSSKLVFRGKHLITGHGCLIGERVCWRREWFVMLPRCDVVQMTLELVRGSFGVLLGVKSCEPGTTSAETTNALGSVVRCRFRQVSCGQEISEWMLMIVGSRWLVCGASRRDCCSWVFFGLLFSHEEHRTDRREQERHGFDSLKPEARDRGSVGAVPTGASGSGLLFSSFAPHGEVARPFCVPDRFFVGRTTSVFSRSDRFSDKLVGVRCQVGGGVVASVVSRSVIEVVIRWSYESVYSIHRGHAATGFPARQYCNRQSAPMLFMRSLQRAFPNARRSFCGERVRSSC